MTIGAVDRYKRRRQERRAKRAVHRQQEESWRQQSDDLTNKATSAYDNAEQYIPQTSNFQGVTGDPSAEAAQRQALGQLQQVGAQGWTDADRAALGAGQRQAAQFERSQRDAVMQSARARGMGGSGMAFMGSMMAQQAGADRAADTAANLGMEGRQRALTALQSGAGLAGQMRDQSFGQQAARAGALDEFNQSNFANRMGITDARAGAQQNAAQYWQLRAQDAYQRRRNKWGDVMNMISGAGNTIASIWGASRGGSKNGGDE